jgi:hypothetical protein
VNLPESHSGRWSESLTAEKMHGCIWLRAVLVARFEFLDWTPDHHLQHAKFIGLQHNRKPHHVIRDDMPELKTPLFALTERLCCPRHRQG